MSAPPPVSSPGSIPPPPGGQSLPRPSGSTPASPVLDDIEDIEEEDLTISEGSGLLDLSEDSVLAPIPSGAAAGTPPPPPPLSSPPPVAPRASAPAAAVGISSAPPPPPTAGSPPRTLLGVAPAGVGETTTAASQSLPIAVETEVDLPFRPKADEPPFDEPLLDDDPFDSALDLEEDDVLLDEITSGDMSDFDQQTAVSDVRAMAQELAGGIDDDLPPDLLEEIDLPELAISPSPNADAELFQLDAEPEPSFKPQAQQASKGGIPKMYVLVIGGLVFLLVVILIVGLTGEDVGEEGAENAVAVEENVGEAAADNTKPASKTEQPDKVEESQAAAPSGTAHKCHKLSDYPAFPWKDKLELIAKSADKESLCELFDLSEKDVVAALRSEPSYGPTGYDLLPNASVFEIFPTGTAARRGPSMEFVFWNKKLIEIRLKYQMTASSALHTTLFADLLGNPPNSPKDATGRDVSRYTDMDMAITRYHKKDDYDRVFNELVFASNLAAKTLMDSMEKRQQALDAFARGSEFFAARKPTKAIGQFRKAQRLAPKMGLAYVMEGITLIQSEQFDTAAVVARKAMENSVDDRAKAGALGLQAVISLYSGFKEMALELFQKAAELDPTDVEYKTSVGELKSGRYEAARVAKTAARMSCLKTHSDWSQKGLLARGNFPDIKVYNRQYKRVRRNNDFQSSFDMWVGWECQ